LWRADPRYGNLGFLPKKRSRRGRGRIKSFPKDDASKKPHLTGFMGFKAGMTHIVRDLDRPGSKAHKKEIVEPVTIIETPPMVAVGVIGYIKSYRGEQTYKAVWAQNISEEAKRRFYKRYSRSKKTAFRKYAANYDQKKVKADLEDMKKHCSSIRVITHTQMSKVGCYKKNGAKKAHILEVQVNGGSVADKVDFAYGLFEKEIPVSAIFAKDEMIDVIGITKGHGFEGTVTRWGVSRLPRKTHRGLRRVGCIGSWHPAQIQWTTPRCGQRGFHHRTEINKKVYRLGQKGTDSHSATTDHDVTVKGITPMGGFPNFGVVSEDYIMVKGSVAGPHKRALTLRQTLLPQTKRAAVENVTLKFIDTAAKNGHGRFQTSEEKAKTLGRA